MEDLRGEEVLDVLQEQELPITAVSGEGDAAEI